MPDAFAEQVEAAKQEEFQADAKGQIAQLQTERKLDALTSQEPQFPPGYESAMVDIGCNLVAAAIAPLPLVRFGDKLAPIISGQTLMAGNILAQFALRWTQGRWPGWVSFAQMVAKASRVVAEELVKAELKKRSEEAKNPAPPAPPEPSPMVPQSAVSIPLPPPKPT